MTKSIQIPPRLNMRPKDRRGYPIPYIVFTDADGRPHFTINDATAVNKAIMQKRCGLCGTKLERDAWLVGGFGAAFHRNGAFLDPPMHRACAEYALRVCPFLAVSYSKRIDAKTLDLDKAEGRVIVKEDVVAHDQPEVFVLAHTASYSTFDPQPGIIYIIPKRPWKEVTFWVSGWRIDAAEAEKLYSTTNQSGPMSDMLYFPR